MSKWDATAEVLSDHFGTEITATDYGFHIKDTPYGGVAVYRMIFNWRLVRENTPLSFDRGWCYFGTDIVSLYRAINAAIKWDGSDGTKPDDWSKDVFTGELNPNAPTPLPMA